MHPGPTGGRDDTHHAGPRHPVSEVAQHVEGIGIHQPDRTTARLAGLSNGQVRREDAPDRGRSPVAIHQRAAGALPENAGPRRRVHAARAQIADQGRQVHASLEGVSAKVGFEERVGRLGGGALGAPDAREQIAHQSP
jgi:hypothetical protein